MTEEQKALIGVTVGDVPDVDVKDYWYRQGKDDGVQVERERILAWLRKEAIFSTDTVRRRMNKALDQLEAGEHLK